MQRQVKVGRKQLKCSLRGLKKILYVITGLYTFLSEDSFAL